MALARRPRKASKPSTIYPFHRGGSRDRPRKRRWSSRADQADQAPHLRVHETDRSVIGANHLAGFRFGSVAADEEIGVAFRNGDFWKSGRRRRARGEIGRQ